ncbi:MAG: acyltransferase family protein [Ginsengibacter sp.]
MQFKTVAFAVSDRSKWFAGVNSIRFILALVVLLGHADNPIAENLRNSDFVLAKYFGLLLSVSFVGVVAVIAFFIISGFVIHYPNKNGILSLGSFFISRYLRVLIPLIALKILGIPFDNPENAVVWSLYCE